MNIEDVKEMDIPDIFLYWIKERESIRIKKERGDPKPWTDDEILSRFRFCNVVRMEDKVSRWLYNHWYKTNYNHKNMVVACCLARFINKPESLQSIGFPSKWEPEMIKKTLREIKAEGVTVFNSAYIVRGNDGDDKIASVVDYYCQPLIDYPLDINRDSMQETHQALCDRHGFGSFMAGQVVADMRWAIKGNWRDRNSWAPYGPGSLRGMNRFHGRPVDSLKDKNNFLEELREYRDFCYENLPDSITDKLELMDLQNTLCECDKFLRCLFSEGRPKQRYNGTI